MPVSCSRVGLRGHGHLGEVVEPAQQPRSTLPEGISPTVYEEPLFCLFEDDNLITGLTTKTDRLLEPGSPPLGSPAHTRSHRADFGHVSQPGACVIRPKWTRSPYIALHLYPAPQHVGQTEGAGSIAACARWRGTAHTHVARGGERVCP